MAYVDPLTRISPHFILGDFLGNQTVYSRGFRNMMEDDEAAPLKLANLTALCEAGLENIMAAWGPLSISYGYISPELSRQIVRYQDPDKPSHHRFDLGAAADICVHKWVQNEYPLIEDVFLPSSAIGSPIALAHAIDQADIPYSRLITYSESPFLCLAVSSEELAQDRPRKAFYENRFQGKPKEKPEYIQLSNQGARNRHFAQLQDQGLEHPWAGGGFPSYHGGGYNQYQHRRVSKYTMVSDWLQDLQSIANGKANRPALNLDSVQDALAAAGMVYDAIIDLTNTLRLSIIVGYCADWKLEDIAFSFIPPATRRGAEFASELNGLALPGCEFLSVKNHSVVATVDVGQVLTCHDWPAPL